MCYPKREQKKKICATRGGATQANLPHGAMAVSCQRQLHFHSLLSTPPLSTPPSHPLSNKIKKQNMSQPAQNSSSSKKKPKFGSVRWLRYASFPLHSLLLLFFFQVIIENKIKFENKSNPHHLVHLNIMQFTRLN